MPSPPPHDAMREFQIPGTVVNEFVIPARGYAAFQMTRGQVLRFVDVAGKQVLYTWAS